MYFNIVKFGINLKCRDEALRLTGIKMYIRHTMILETKVKNENKRKFNINKWAKLEPKLNMSVT